MEPITNTWNPFTIDGSIDVKGKKASAASGLNVGFSGVKLDEIMKKRVVIYRDKLLSENEQIKMKYKPILERKHRF